MLSKKERFSRSQFSEFLANKGISVVYNALGTLKYHTPHSTKALAVVTSAKHEKKAVSRNKLRRRVYALFQDANPPIQGILYTSKASYALQYADIQRLFHELLKKTIPKTIPKTAK